MAMVSKRERVGERELTDWQAVVGGDNQRAVSDKERRWDDEREGCVERESSEKEIVDIQGI